MFRNYLRVAVRNLRKDKLISLINILGLTLGITGCILAFVLVNHEFSYDNFHKDPDKIFHVHVDRNSFQMGSTVYKFLPTLIEDFEEVEAGVRIGYGSTICQWSNDLVSKHRINFADSNYFEFFNFPIIYGNKAKMLNEKHAVVLNEEIAQKYFPNENPVGKIIKLYIEQEFISFKITGVVTVPTNSSLEFEMVAPLMSKYLAAPPQKFYSWANYQFETWIRIKDGSQIEHFQDKMPSFVSNHLSEYLESQNISLEKFRYFFVSMKDMRFSNWASGKGMLQRTDARQLYIFIGIAILVLVIACFNFINLTNAKASTRVGEIGLRKVIGAQKRQLIFQFLLEAVLMSLIATVIGFCLADILLPFLNQLIEHELIISYTSELMLMVLSIALGTGVLAGIYPAFVMSNLKPIDTLRNKQLTIGGNHRLTQLSIIFQFGLCIGLLIASFIMYEQHQFIKKYDLGYDPQQVIIVPFEDANATQSQQLLASFKQKLGQYPQVESVSGTNFAFTRGIQFFMAREVGSDEQKLIISYNIDEEYRKTMGITLLHGENFSKNLSTDGIDKIIVNQSLLKEFKISEKEAVNYVLPENFEELAGKQIIGVIKDVHFMNLRTEIIPMVLKMDKENIFGDMLVKTASDNYSEVIALIESHWNEVRPNYPFEYQFLDENVEKQYRSDQQWNTITTGAGLLALLISCIGLFGLTALTMVKRTKEIGIRKVLGASQISIVKLVGRQFLGLVLAANAIAVPVSFWMMNDWLQDFAYKTEIGVFPFLVAASTATAIAIFTISHHILRVARANPVEALRNE